MRTTLVIDDDILRIAKKMAAAEKKSLGEVISSLARRTLVPAKARVKTRNGVPLLKGRKRASRVTSEFVQELHEEISLSDLTEKSKKHTDCSPSVH